MGVPSSASAAERELTAQQHYDLGVRYMKRGYYTKAIEEFNRVRNFYRDDPASLKAEIAIADMHFEKGEFEPARLAYEDFARLHPRHEDMDYVVYRIGLCHYKRAPRVAGRDQSSTRQALMVWTGFSERFPSSEHLADVQEMQLKAKDRLARKELDIARFYARRGAWQATQRRAEGLVRKYPDSRYAEEAEALLAEAWFERGAVTQAQAVREDLAQAHPESPWLHAIDRTLAGPPGTPPAEETFVRPVHIPGMGMASPSQPAQ